ncbi:MAG: glycosyltransferase [Methanomassiliicoccaceae archaeon]|nr:glycosyltransferase [Methanomassiliicoccaceae archaeon]
MLSVSVCICAYNEESNIEHTVRSLFSQTTNGFEMTDVIVVSSGSADRTDEIVMSLTKEFPSLELLRQEKRMGKNSAINEFLERKRGDICVLLNGDNILRDELSLYNLVSPFNDPKVGMVGGRPVPTNDPKELMGFVSHMIWTMHHHVSMRDPKIGELVAFRDVGARILSALQLDEDILRMEIEKEGYASVYAPGAVVLNRGPETVKDFITQRVRINAGLEYLQKELGCSVSTWNKGLLLRALVGSVRDLGFRPFKMSFGIILEVVARGRAKTHVSANRGFMTVWDHAGSTKRVKKD